METIVIIVSIVFPLFVLMLIIWGAFRLKQSREIEQQKNDRQTLVMKRIIDKKNEIIGRMSELIEE
ncbi:hypothetical protein WSM22_03270 [Cytophagales bacterium WSM2-2]|nr:hypothetical protein WSM22_03270 [Cytophagales bacterium WSM2-2]